MRYILDYVEKSFQNYNKVTMIANNSSSSTSDNDFCFTWTKDDKRWLGLLFRLSDLAHLALYP